MADLRLLAVLAVAATALAGCSSAPADVLDSVYGADAMRVDVPSAIPGIDNGTKVAVIFGSHLEARIDDAAWGGNATVQSVTAVSAPLMTGAEPLGGGGETTPLPLAANHTLELRVKEFGQLAGYDVVWMLTTSGMPAEPVRRAVDERFEFPLPAVGRVEAFAILVPSGETAPEGVFAQGLTIAVTATWAITGEVQPVKAAGGLPVEPTARDEMVDKFAVDLPEGVTVTATSKFEGTYGPTDGADVDLGLYSPDGVGVLCAAGSLGVGSSPVDPAQSSESFTGATDGEGTWTIEIGAMLDGCPIDGNAGSFSYYNVGPVPYSLEVVVS